MQTPSENEFWANQMDAVPDLSQSLYLEPYVAFESAGAGLVSSPGMTNEPFGNVETSLAVPVTGYPTIDWQSLVGPTNDWHTNAPVIGPGHNMNVAASVGQNPATANVLDADLADNIDPDRHACTWHGCNTTFGRKADRDRHIATKHRNVRYYYCRVAGCPKSRGSNTLRAWKGYSRIDKLQEHMRKKHAAVEGSFMSA